MEEVIEVRASLTPENRRRLEELKWRLGVKNNAVAISEAIRIATEKVRENQPRKEEKAIG